MDQFLPAHGGHPRVGLVQASAKPAGDWRRRVYQAFPPEQVDTQKERQLDQWRFGQPLPGFAQPAPHRDDAHSDHGTEVDLGERQRGRPRRQLVCREYRYGDPHAIRQQRVPRNATGQFECPVCQQTFAKANQLSFHYEAQHAIADPKLVTTQVFPRDKCGTSFCRQHQRKSHVCPALQPLARLRQIDPLEAVGGPPDWDRIAGSSTVPPFTDGSGGQGHGAGWGVGIFVQPQSDFNTAWTAALYGPVLVTSFDPLWLGATQHTNNTAELSGIGEACRWVLDSLDQGRILPPQACIHYDSMYAYGVSN